MREKLTGDELSEVLDVFQDNLIQAAKGLLSEQTEHGGPRSHPAGHFLLALSGLVAAIRGTVEEVERREAAQNAAQADS